MEHDEIYVCLSCGHEDDPDRFGRHCPRCDVDLDELEADLPQASKDNTTE